MYEFYFNPSTEYNVCKYNQELEQTVCSLVEMNELIVRQARMLIYTGRPWLGPK